MNGPGGSASRTISRLLAKIIQPHKMLQPSLNNYPDFLKVPPKMPAYLGTRKQSRENNAHIPKRWIMDTCLCLCVGVANYYWSWLKKKLSKGVSSKFSF